MPSSLAALRALRRDVIGLWPRAAYEDDVVSGRLFSKPFVLLNGAEFHPTGPGRQYRQLSPAAADGPHPRADRRERVAAQRRRRLEEAAAHRGAGLREPVLAGPRAPCRQRDARDDGRDPGCARGHDRSARDRAASCARDRRPLDVFARSGVLRRAAPVDDRKLPTMARTAGRFRYPASAYNSLAARHRPPPFSVPVDPAHGRGRHRPAGSARRGCRPRPLRPSEGRPRPRHRPRTLAGSVARPGGDHDPGRARNHRSRHLLVGVSGGGGARGAGCESPPRFEASISGRPPPAPPFSGCPSRERSCPSPCVSTRPPS